MRPALHTAWQTAGTKRCRSRRRSPVSATVPSRKSGRVTSWINATGRPPPVDRRRVHAGAHERSPARSWPRSPAPTEAPRWRRAPAGRSQDHEDAHGRSEHRRDATCRRLSSTTGLGCARNERSTGRTACRGCASSTSPISAARCAPASSADFGADVIRVERGDPPDSLAHAYRNANKRSVVLDRATTRPTGPTRRPARATPTCWSRTSTPTCDGTMALARAPPASRARRAHRPRAERPRAGWHLEPLPALAASGALWASGFPDLPPCNGPGHLAHDCASVYGAIGAVAAVARPRRGATTATSASVVEVARRKPGSRASSRGRSRCRTTSRSTRCCPPKDSATPTARTGCSRVRRLGARGGRFAEAVGAASSR